MRECVALRRWVGSRAQEGRVRRGKPEGHFS